MNRICFALWLLLVSVQFSCKGTKSVSTAGIRKMKAEKIIANHYNKAFDFETINAKVKVKYDDGKQSFSPSVTLRMEKDQKIWVSAKFLGVTMAKVLITPTRVSYYEKLNGTYFDGDFKMLSNWLGADLDYQKVQQLLLGQSLFDLKEQKFEASIQEKTYQLVPKKDLELFQRLFGIYPESYKMASQRLQQPKENRDLLIAYQSYQKVGNQDFPLEMRIAAKEGDDQTMIKLEYKSVDYNAKVGFPFKIPSGYKQITIE